MTEDPKHVSQTGTIKAFLPDTKAAGHENDSLVREKDSRSLPFIGLIRKSEMFFMKGWAVFWNGFSRAEYDSLPGSAMIPYHFVEAKKPYRVDIYSVMECKKLYEANKVKLHPRILESLRLEA